MPEPNNHITLVVEGRPEDNGDVRLEDFIAHLNDWKKLLYEADRIVSGRQSVYYRIVDLRHESPATVVLEPVLLQVESEVVQPDFGELVGTAVFEGVRSLQQGGDMPAAYDYPALSAFRAVSIPSERVGVTRLVTRLGEVTVGPEVAQRVDEITKLTEFELGSTTGYVERLNIHGESRVFYVYPEYGPEKVKCYFPLNMRERVIQSVGQYATVHGTFRYRSRQLHADELIRVTDIDIHLPEEKLPSISAFKGIFADGKSRKENAP